MRIGIITYETITSLTAVTDLSLEHGRLYVFVYTDAEESQTYKYYVFMLRL